MRNASFSVLFAVNLCIAAPKESPTFYKHVLPILQARCQSCHRPGETAPFAMTSYKDTRPWAKSIKEAVLMKRMPPWFADPSVGHFRNDRSMKEGEVETLIAWVDGGAKEGNPKDAPEPVQYAEGWNIGKPDLVFEMPNAYKVPSEGTIAYQYVVIPSGFKENTWVQAAEIRPGNRKVVHHSIVFLREPQSKWLREAEPGAPYAKGTPQKPSAPSTEENGSNGSLIGFVPGYPVRRLDAGQAMLVKAGSDFVLQMHYTANGKEAEDKSKFGVVLAKEQPKERVVNAGVVNQKFVIPPGDANYRAEAAFTVKNDAKLMALTPHMHLRGKAFEFRVVYPDGNKETLLHVPKYDFNWQINYELAEARVLPKGTKIECTAWWDNSANNPNNPDPKAEVRWGDQSWEEMLFGGMQLLVEVKPADSAPRTSGGGGGLD